MKSMAGGSMAGPAKKADAFSDLLGGALGKSSPTSGGGSLKAGAAAAKPTTPTPAAAQPAATSLGGTPSKTTPPPSTDDLLAAFAGGPAKQTTSADISTPAFSEQIVGDDVEHLPPPPRDVDSSRAATEGNQALSEGRYADAIKWFTWSIDLSKSGGKVVSSGTLFQVLLKRAECFKEIGEQRNAIADVTQALELEPGNCKVLLKRAYLYEGSEKYSKALADFQEVNRLQGGTDPKVENSILRMEKAVKTMC